VEFTNGYNKQSPQITLEVSDITIGTGNLLWGAVADTQYFIIKLGREVGRQNCCQPLYSSLFLFYQLKKIL
jgi:hypothetical protein